MDVRLTESAGSRTFVIPTPVSGARNVSTWSNLVPVNKITIFHPLFESFRPTPKGSRPRGGNEARTEKGRERGEDAAVRRGGERGERGERGRGRGAEPR